MNTFEVACNYQNKGMTMIQDKKVIASIEAHK